MIAIPLLKKAVRQLQAEKKAVTKENILRLIPAENRSFVKMMLLTWLNHPDTGKQEFEEWLETMFSMGDELQKNKFR
jgi:hypothetical protein